jgi:hypothetical protein
VHSAATVTTAVASGLTDHVRSLLELLVANNLQVEAAWFSLLLWTDYTPLDGASAAGLGAAIVATIRIKQLVKGPEIPVELTEGLLNTTSGKSAGKNPTLS